MAKAELYGQEFDTLIKNHGIVCDYHAAIVCECITKDSQQPDYTCPKCGGSGYRYLPPKSIRVVVTSFSSKTDHDLMSLRESGTAYATPQPDTIMGFHDRLVFPDFKCKYSERMWVDVNGTITNKSYRNIKDVIAVIHEDSCFEPGVDYEISEDQYHIEFSKPIGELLDIGYDDTVDGQVPISVLYYTTPSYLVVDLLHELRSHYTTRYVPSERFEELPKQYRLKREDFVYDVRDFTETNSSVETEDTSSYEGSGLFD